MRSVLAADELRWRLCVRWRPAARSRPWRTELGYRYPVRCGQWCAVSPASRSGRSAGGAVDFVLHGPESGKGASDRSSLLT